MGTLKIDIVDVYGDFINEKVEILLFNNRLSSDRVRISGIANDTIEVVDLRDSTNNTYRLQIEAPSYQIVQRFVNVTPDKEITVTLPVETSKVASVEFPKFSTLPADTKRLMSNSRSSTNSQGKSGARVYDALDILPRAGLLNICTKCDETFVSPGLSVLSQLQSLITVKQDRIFARVHSTLRDEIDNADNVFKDASGSQHTFENYARAGSWKTRDEFANLQLTFFNKGTDWVVDVDIDDFNGFAHLFQVVNNVFAGGTHPYNIQQMLIKQELDPGYRLVLEQTRAARAG